MPLLRFNKKALKDDCNAEEYQTANVRLAELFDGLLLSRGFDAVNWVGITTRAMELAGGARMLRGTSEIQEKGELIGDDRKLRREDDVDRELQQCDGIDCGRMPYICQGFCSDSRRRLTHNSGNGNDEYEGEDYDALKADIKSTMESQCKSLLLLIGVTAEDFQPSCRHALYGASCTVFVKNTKVSEFFQERLERAAELEDIAQEGMTVAEEVEYLERELDELKDNEKRLKEELKEAKKRKEEEEKSGSGSRR